MSRDRGDVSAARAQAAARADREAARLPPEFEGLARLAASVCCAPLASVVIAGWGHACYESEARPGPLIASVQDPFLACAARSSDVFEVRDTRVDPRFCDAEHVRGALGIRWFAGCALRSADGDLLGTLGVYDTTVRELSAEQYDALSLVARQCVAQAELRARVAELEFVCAAEPSAPAYWNDASIARELLDSAPVAVYHADLYGNLAEVNPEYRRLFSLAPEQSPHDRLLRVIPEDRTRMEDAWADFCRAPRPMRFEYRVLASAGTVRLLAEQVAAMARGGGFVGTILDLTELAARVRGAGAAPPRD